MNRNVEAWRTRVSHLFFRRGVVVLDDVFFPSERCFGVCMFDVFFFRFCCL